MSGHSTGTGRSTAESTGTVPPGPSGAGRTDPDSGSVSGRSRGGAGTGEANPAYPGGEDRRDFERVIERAAGPDSAERARARDAAARIASLSSAEYDAYLRARRDSAAERGGFSPARAWTGSVVSAGMVLAAEVATDMPPGPAAGVASLVLASAAATSYLASAGSRKRDPERAALAREHVERLRREWYSAVERAVREVLDGRPDCDVPAASLPPQRSGGRPGAAGTTGGATGSGRPDGTGGRPRRVARRSEPSPAAESALSRSFSKLPLQEGVFVGRDHCLSLISQWARDALEGPQDRPCVVVLHGPPGSGRTALAVRAAEMMRERYRGMCLVNLRGRASGQGGESPQEGVAPLSTRDALLHLLNRLGAPQQDLLFRDPSAHDVHLRKLLQQYQEHTAGLPAVLILDDAADARQVRPLIPEQSRSLVLVTSRQPLEPGDGAVVHNLPVEPLSPDEAQALFSALTGPMRQPPSGEAVTRASGGLPLAIRMAGAALAHAPHLPLPSGGPAPTDSVIRLGYAALDPEAQRLFRRLVLVGRASLGSSAAAALLRTDEGEAAERLDALARAHMVEHVHSGRYRLPDLLRSFARERLREEDDWQEVAAAAERLINDYAELATSVIHQVEGASSSRAVRAPVRGFESLDAALRWLDEESSFITATLRHTEHIDPAAVLLLVEALCDYCLLRGDLYRLGEIGELTQSLGRDPLIRAVKLRTGIAARQLGQLDRARTTLSSVVSLYREGHNEAGAARALCSLGITLHHRGALSEAEAKLREAVELQRPQDQRADRAWTLHALGAVLRDRGRLAEAWELLHQALALHEEAESLHGQAWTYLQLGQVHLRIGQVDEAEEQLWLSQELYRRTRDNRGEAWALTQLGRARLLRGQAEHAVRELNGARTRHRDIEDARGEAWTLYYLGLALEDTGRLDRAEDALSRARHMFSTMGDRYGHACARHHFGRVTRDRLAERSGSLRNSGFPRQLLHEARQDFRTVGLPHGEAWSCVELAVIDAGCGRIGRAAELLGDARELFRGLGDGHGESWAVFLHSTLLPLTSRDGLSNARETLERLVREPDERCHPLVRQHARTWLDGPWIDTKPDSPWPVWQLGLAPKRTARDVMGVLVQREHDTAGPLSGGLPGD